MFSTMHKRYILVFIHRFIHSVCICDVDLVKQSASTKIGKFSVFSRINLPHTRFFCRSFLFIISGPFCLYHPYHLSDKCCTSIFLNGVTSYFNLVFAVKSVSEREREREDEKSKKVMICGDKFKRRSARLKVKVIHYGR